MRKSGLLAIIIVLILIAAGVVALTHKKSPGNPQPATSQSQPKTNNSPASNTNQPSASGTINIKDMMFTPSQITVAKGGTVTWTNNDSVAHTVVEDNGPGPNSSPIQPGGTYSYTFTQAGSYQYHCSIHPSMRGTIVVQ